MNKETSSPMNPLLAAKALGQQIWLDDLSRPLLRDGSLRRLIEEDGIDGVTSNPTIFAMALSSPTDGAHYQADREKLMASGLSAEQQYESLIIADIRDACDLLHPTFERSGGDAGYVSLEVSPALAYDETGSVAAVQRLRATVGRDNLLLKLPATPAGIDAFERLIGEGYRVNMTLIFSLAQYEAVAQAYLRGARRWLHASGDPRRPKSVASFFLSRIDSAVDPRLERLATPAATALRGHAALALAKNCYRRYQGIFHGADFADLAAAGVRPQYPLWASTGTKNPTYSDVKYVEALIGAESVNTMPQKTLLAFRAHGNVAPTLPQRLDEASEQVHRLAELGIDLNAVGEQLLKDGVRLFAESYDKVIGVLL